MRTVKSRNFWIGAVVGVVVWNVALPRFAPQLKAKLPLG